MKSKKRKHDETIQLMTFDEKYPSWRKRYKDSNETFGKKL